LSFVIISYLLFTIIHLLDALFLAVTSSLIYSIFQACKWNLMQRREVSKICIYCGS